MWIAMLSTSGVDSPAVFIPVANSSGVSQKACEGRVPGPCSRCTREPLRHGHEIQRRRGQQVTEMSSGQPSIPGVAHSAAMHAL
jgi:hypothetical protein